MATRTTDAKGRYTFSQVATTLGADYYSLTPSKTGLTFTPASRTTSTDEDVTGLDFTAQVPALTITIFPDTLRGARTLHNAHVVRDNPAPRGGVVIELRSSDPQAVTLPEFVRITEGKSAASFAITAKPRRNTTTTQITGTYGNASYSAPLTITPGSMWEAGDIALSSTGGDLSTRVLWNNVPGALSLWRIPAGGKPGASAPFGPYEGWSAKAIAQGGDGKTYVNWNHWDNRLVLWRLSTSGELEGNFSYGPFGGWQADDIAVGTDGNTRVLWNDIASQPYPQVIGFTPPQRGAMSLWRVSPEGQIIGNTIYGPYDGWTAKSLAVGPDEKSRVLWTRTDGQIALWTVPPEGAIETNFLYGPHDGWSARDIAVGPDNRTRVMWTHTDGRLSLWTIASNGTPSVSPTYGPYAAWDAKSVTVGSDGKTRVMWVKDDGQMALWTVGASGTIETNFLYGPH